MRGGGARATVARKTASSRRRRDRFTRDANRDSWGAKRELIADEDDWDDTEVDTAC
jgi:hypothetical protein